MRSPAIGQRESEREANSAYAAVVEARALSARARAELKELAELRTAREESDKRLEDNKRIVHTLAELLPPYVAKVRDVQADFQEFDESFPKLEEAVKVYHARSRKTSNDIGHLRGEVERMTQKHEVFLRLTKFMPLIGLSLLIIIPFIFWR